MLDQLAVKFKLAFGHVHTNVFFAPGRINLIGEHIDYNGGLVMPCAITFGTYLLIAPNTTNTFRFRSVNFDEVLDIEVQDSYTKKETLWYNYPVGVVHRFLKSGKKVKGFDMLFFGNIPIGSGLSSSASIEIVTAYALNTLLDLGFTKLDLVKLCKDVENNFIGLNSGIMDQFAVAFGEANKALQLNCDTLEYITVDCDLGDNVLTIINTNKPRKLAESKYNERVKECNAALKALSAEVKANYLCDMDTQVFTAHQHLIKDDIVRKRARHVVEENQRVKQAAKELAAGNLSAFGRLMYASHDSLQHLYEVSGIELDAVVEYCHTNKNVVGARMTGAGFGGCAIALVNKAHYEDFYKEIIVFYTGKIGYAPSVYTSMIGDGVQVLP